VRESLLQFPLLCRGFLVLCKPILGERRKQRSVEIMTFSPARLSKRESWKGKVVGSFKSIGKRFVESSLCSELERRKKMRA
jgi:hypothetical protein